MPSSVKIATKLAWPSFRNVAETLRKALKPLCPCRTYDLNTVKPGGRIIFVGTADKPTLRIAERLIPTSDVVFYGTTEGISHIDPKTLQAAKRLKIVAVSNFAKQMLEAIGLSVAGVLHHGIAMNETATDASFYRKLTTNWRNREIILAISANHSRKGLDRLLEAYRIVENEMPNAALILHSEHNGYYNLEKQAEKLNLKRFWLTEKFGLVGQSRLNTLYQTCDVYVQPSYSEGFGLPILEAFRFNKPVIAVNAPPFNEIIRHNSTGILIPTERVSWQGFKRTIDFKLNMYSADKLAHAILSLLRDPKSRSQMAMSIETEKWRWDADRLYPKLLSYFD